MAIRVPFTISIVPEASAGPAINEMLRAGDRIVHKRLRKTLFGLKCTTALPATPHQKGP